MACTLLVFMLTCPLHSSVRAVSGVQPSEALPLIPVWVYSGLQSDRAGVGAYTGNAIASIACHEPVAVVDANVVRVVSRLRRLAGDPKSKAAVAAQTAVADALLDPERPGDFNQV